MFKITCIQDVNWPDFSLKLGVNEFMSRKDVPAERWLALGRFRDLGYLSFDGPAGLDENEKPTKVTELSERHLFDMDVQQLAELAKASSVSFTNGATKPDLIKALSVKLPQPVPEAASVASVTVDPMGSGKAVITNNPGSSRGPVTVE